MQKPGVQGRQVACADGHEGGDVGVLGAEEGFHCFGRDVGWWGAADEEDVQGGAGGYGVLCGGKGE